ncbi:hypothetical protein K0M31_001335 [Melipona bicolor]|uniref:Uncharacterized protein n=1 Tax=Melipona bicolor TaxID=60889 RepID=A0AA40GFI6_9HYME|nr:hypothetical protein K0M31_001335 [Melipona bicolor]
MDEYTRSFHSTERKLKRDWKVGRREKERGSEGGGEVNDRLNIGGTRAASTKARKEIDRPLWESALGIESLCCVHVHPEIMSRRIRRSSLDICNTRSLADTLVHACAHTLHTASITRIEIA